jgi:ribosomal peptide maturation radical SAM protein 1
VDLDGIPTPDFSDFFEQLRVFLPKSAYIDDQSVMLAYESSRGCPWGQTQPCTFCGSKRATMTFRRKSARRVAEELRHLSKTHASNKLSFMDDCVPAALPRQLVDELNGEPPLCMIAATRATLSLSDVIALGKTGFVALVVGVEALCPSLLEHMNKGVSAPQNINLLRYARSVGLPIPWTLLFGFPGDEARQYEQTLSYLPLLRHLHPPHSLEPVQILRFSAYWKDPARYAVRNLRPPAAYASVLPEHVDPATVALRFEADYPSESCTDSALIGRLGDEVARWQRTWMSDGSPPVLEVAPVAQDRFLLADTRGLPGTQQFSFLNRRRASLILAGSCLDDAENVAWALERKLLLEMDSSLVPLATATPQVLQEFV